MKKVLLLILPLLWIAGAAGQTIPCWYDSIRIKSFATYPKMQQDEDLFYYRLNKWRAKNTLNTYPTPMPFNYNGLLQILPTCFRAKFVIPVVVHVIHRSADASIGTGSNISVAQIQNQIDVLNRYFANYGNTSPKSYNTGIQFCLAPVGTSHDGIFRYTDATSGQTITNHKMSDMKALMDLKPGNLPYEDYLHIYVVNDLVDAAGRHSGIQGYATFPGITPQGIVIRYKRFGDSLSCMNGSFHCPIDNNTEGKVLVHEVGHFLGIQHPFEFGCTGMSVSDCATKGDHCCDVPPVAYANNGCSSSPLNSCNETPDSADMLENYMDYTNDACRNTFTKNQTEIMHFTLLTARSRLVSPENINPMNLGCCSFSARFTASNNILCKRDSVRFTALKYSSLSPTYLWIIKRGDSVKYTASTNYYKHSWSPPNYYANYTVILKVIIGSDTAVDSSRNMVQLINCGSPIKSSQGTWYFGQYAGLKFMQNTVIMDDNAFRGGGQGSTINTYEGCISVCDSLGNLLFYAGGDGDWRTKDGSCRVYTQQHVLSTVKDTSITMLPPGAGTSTQGVVAFPNPANRAQYLIFSNLSATDTGKLYVTTFDTAQGTGGKLLLTNFASGINSFPNYNKVIYKTGVYNKPDTTCYVFEQLAAVSQCNGKDYWLLTTTDSANGSNPLVNVRHLTSYSVKSATNIQATGRIRYKSPEIQGAIKVSPDGSLVIVDRFIYKFDRKTGLFSMFDSLGAYGLGTVYGVSFSPNSKVLYYIDNNYEEDIWQLDLTLKNPALHRQKVAHVPPGYFSTLQLGPDKKIYISISDNDRLAVINNPDSINSFVKPTNCGFSEDGPFTKIGGVGGMCQVGLPNNVDAKPSYAIDKDIVIVQYGCDSVIVRTNVCCAVNYEWDFGDGSTHIFTKDAKHVYSMSSNTYTISLKIDGGTPITRKVTIGIPQNNIMGPASVCDTVHAFPYYSNQLSKGSYDYTWTCSNGTVSKSLLTPYTADVKWRGAGSLYLHVKDLNGCTSDNSIAISIRTNISNNIITLNQNQIPCKIKGKDTISGTVPTGTVGAFQYGWLALYDGSTKWTQLTNEKGRNDTLLNKAKGRSATYKRFIYNFGCYAESNTVHVCNQPNIIKDFDGNCGGESVGSPINCYYNGNATTQWQYSTVSIHFINLTGQTKLNYTIPAGNSLRFYRRLIVAGSCIDSSSNILSNRNTTPKSYELDIVDQYICNSTSEVVTPFKSGYEYQGFSNQFYKKPYGGGSPVPFSVFWPNASYYNNLDTVYCVQSMCGGLRSFSSRKAVIYKANYSPSPSIATHPSNATIASGVNATFTSTVNNSAGAKLTWQSSTDNTNWTDMKNSPNSTTLTLTKVGFCQKSMYYRLKVANACVSPVYSNSALLTVTGLPLNPTQDYWMKDHWRDTGRENNLDTVDLVRSVDLWIRNDPDGKKPNVLTENEFLADWNNDSGNYIYYTVRNKGKDTAKGGKLSLYWTWGGTKEEWSKNWTNNSNNQFYNDSEGRYYPMGGLITTTPINLPSIPPTGGGRNDSIKNYYKWTQDLPKPTWYFSKTKGDGIHHNRANICILARIETCDDPQYGMAFKEKKDILYNVGRNNNIVTRNAWMHYLNAPPGTQRLVYIGGHGPAVDGGTVMVGSTEPTTSTIKLCIDATDQYFYQKADMFIEMDSVLKSVWVASGSSSTGLKLVEGNTYQVLPGGGCINSLLVPAYFTGYMNVYFAYTDVNDRFSDDETYDISLKQFNVANMKTGESWFEIRDNPIIPATAYSYLIVPGTNTEKINKTKVQQEITVYPNPTNRTASVEWNINLNKPFTLNVYDIIGNVIYTKVIQPNELGKYKEIIDLSNQPNGVYNIKLTSDGFKGVTKLILLK